MEKKAKIENLKSKVSSSEKFKVCSNHEIYRARCPRHIQSPIFFSKPYLPINNINKIRTFAR